MPWSKRSDYCRATLAFLFQILTCQIKNQSEEYFSIKGTVENTKNLIFQLLRSCKLCVGITVAAIAENKT